MDWCLVALNKRPGVRPMGICETLRRALAKLVMRAARDQAKTVCGNPSTMRRPQGRREGIHTCYGTAAAREGEREMI